MKIAAHSAYDMFSWYKYLIVNLVFSHLGFWSGNLFLIAPFPDLCLLVLFSNIMDHHQFDEHGLLSERQHAFRKWHTCETQMTGVGSSKPF